MLNFVILLLPALSAVMPYPLPLSSVLSFVLFEVARILPPQYKSPNRWLVGGKLMDSLFKTSYNDLMTSIASETEIFGIPSLVMMQRSNLSPWSINWLQAWITLLLYLILLTVHVIWKMEVRKMRLILQIWFCHTSQRWRQCVMSVTWLAQELLI